VDQRKKIIRVFSPADSHGKIPQIIKNKSAGLFCVDQRCKIIQSDFYWEIIAPKEPVP
jgi:hypothetical protein